MNDNNTCFLDLKEINDHEYKTYRKSIQQILEETSTVNSYIFRKNDYWYLFENWLLPHSGVIRRWKAQVEDDWLPKKGFTDTLRQNNSSIIFDVTHLPSWLVEYEILHVLISPKDEKIAIVGNKNNQFDILISEIDFCDKLAMLITDVSMESSFSFLKEGILYAKNDRFGRPNKVYYGQFENHSSQLLYEEKDSAFRVKIQGLNQYHVALIKSESFIAASIYLCSIHNKVVLDKVWSPNDRTPISTTFCTIQHQEYIAFSFKDNTGLGKCLFKNIKKTHDVHQLKLASQISVNKIFGMNNTVILTYTENSHQKMGIVVFGDSLIQSQIYDIHPIDQQNKWAIYQNNFAPFQVFLTSSDNMFEETMRVYFLPELNNKVVFKKNVNVYKKNAPYYCRLLWATSRDEKTEIPISLFWKKLPNNQLPKKAKGVIQVYGAYGKKEIESKLDPMAIAIIESGFVYCVAHVRGGGFLGGEWYRAGRKLNKWHSIFDLIDCCDFLIDECILDKERIGLVSSSAGGIIAGATLNQRKELFKAMLLFSPFVNPLGALMNEADPLSKTEIIEWGNPINNIEERNYIASYSPLQHTDQACGSSTLVLSTAGVQDVYVSTEDILKWSKSLNKYGVDARVLVNQNAGHSGISAGDFQLMSKLLSYFLCSIVEGKNDNK